jgi:hypothetical protein
VPLISRRCREQAGRASIASVSGPRGVQAKSWNRHDSAAARPSGYTHFQLMRIAWKVALATAGLVLALASGAAAKGGEAVCKANSDCVLVPDDCCGCTGGGKQKALPKKDKAGAERARQARCAGTLCAEVMSQDPSCAATSAICKEGKCTLGS